jgi:hypothetical protein
LNVFLYLDFECAGNAAAGSYGAQEDIAIIGHDWADSLDVEITPLVAIFPTIDTAGSGCLDTLLQLRRLASSAVPDGLREVI